MIRRSTVIALEVVLGLLALLAIPTAVLLWRLASGPVEVDFLTPYIAEAFEESTPESSVEVGATVLQWQGLARSIDLKARNIRFIGKEGDLALALPEVSVKLSVRALMRGVIAPTVIQVRDAYIYLVRQADGAIRLEYRSAPPGEDEAPGGAERGGLAASGGRDAHAPMTRAVARRRVRRTPRRERPFR